MDEKNSTDIEEVNGNLIMTIYSPKKCLITVAINDKEKDRIHHRTVKFDKPMSGKERQEMVNMAVTEVLL